MLSLVLLLLLGYLLLISLYTHRWRQIPDFHISPEYEEKRRGFSILIPVRNEEANIGNLLTALKGQQYPSDLMEIIVIDDDSTDRTHEVVKCFPIAKWFTAELVSGAGGKKRAIETGIRNAKHQWIVTTDADSIPGPDWISTLSAFIDQKPVCCVVGPVTLTNHSHKPLQAFQRYDHLMFQGITAAAVDTGLHPLGNGANLCFLKESFEQIGGFRGIDSIASGDDVLLIEKFMNEYPGKVRFLKSRGAIVETQPCTSWKELWQQRIRWASKAGLYQSSRLKAIQGWTGIFNLTLIIQSFVCLVKPDEWRPTLAAWIIKALIEWSLINPVAKLYQVRRSLPAFLLLQPLHALYIVALGLFGKRRTYSWKGRSVR